MRIAVIGAGNVGTAVGEAWQRSGHEVIYGVRDPTSSKYVRIEPTRLATVLDAAAGADVIALAVPWQGADAACRELGDLSGKIVIDCTNPLVMTEEGLNLALGFTTSGVELVARWCRGAGVFKTLNQVGFEVMADASRSERQPVMFVAGDDVERKPTVIQLVKDLGFEALDAGPLRAARLLEPYAMLWINLATRAGWPRDFAFSISRRRAG